MEKCGILQGIFFLIMKGVLMDFDRNELYPMLFEPALKEVMWGGDLLTRTFARTLPETSSPIGESWEIYDRPGSSSLVSNGAFAGTPLHKLVEIFRKDFVGKNFQGEYFPLIVKLIDAGKRLSLQVHPTESACKLLGKGEPKTEMWYILAAAPGAKIFAGFNHRATKMRFVDSLDSSDLENMLQSFDSVPGDAYFIYSGRVHAIGGGNLILEIQQNSDTTFRVSDWGRVDANGKSRELHINEALASIDFADRTVPHITGVSSKAGHNCKYNIISQCPFFRVDDLRIVEKFHDTTFTTGSCHLLSAVKTPFTVGNDRFQTKVPAGSTVLIPASFGAYDILPEEGTTPLTVIRTTI